MMSNNTAASDAQMEMDIETRASEQTNQINNSNVKNLLTMARQLVDQGNPSLALQAVVMAVKSDGGHDAVIQTLNRARELYRNKLRASADADELTSLFAECAIAEAQPAQPAQPLESATSPCNTGGPSMSAMPDVDETSILAKTGRKQIMLDAFSDGSSFICLQCGGLVSNYRKDEHLAYWCGKI